jgi:hypothetical protein
MRPRPRCSTPYGGASSFVSSKAPRTPTFAYRLNGGVPPQRVVLRRRQWVGTSSSSNIYFEGCRPDYLGGSLADVTCALVSAEPSCPDSPCQRGSQLSEPLEIPFADKQLSPWCDPS